MHQPPSDNPSQESLRSADAEGGDVKGSGPAFDWSGLAPRVVHPTKIAVIEALSWIDQPLSPLELAEVFDGQLSLGSVVQHVRSLFQLQALVVADGGPGRSIVSTRYVLSP